MARVGSCSVQPARNAAYHEGRAGVFSGVRPGLGTAFLFSMCLSIELDIGEY